MRVLLQGDISLITDPGQFLEQSLLTGGQCHFMRRKQVVADTCMYKLFDVVLSSIHRPEIRTDGLPLHGQLDLPIGDIAAKG